MGMSVFNLSHQTLVHRRFDPLGTSSTAHKSPQTELRFQSLSHASHASHTFWWCKTPTTRRRRRNTATTTAVSFKKPSAEDAPPPPPALPPTALSSTSQVIIPKLPGDEESQTDVAEEVSAGVVEPGGGRRRKVKEERMTYLFAAVASTLGITTLAAASVYYRFVWQMQGSGEVPMEEMFGTFSLAVGAAVGMEFWARWAHKALWHASLWNMHESHHRPREGPFELNDVFAIINAVPAIALLSYGFFNKGLVPGLCFGAGLGITVFGMAYMFVHDGLVHRRFPVGPIADVPYFQKVAAAHQLHHADLFDGVPYGLFLGPKELEEVGGLEELERLVNRRRKPQKQRIGDTETTTKV